MAEPAAFQVPLQSQLALLSQTVEDSEVIQAVVATGHDAWLDVLELLVDAGWEEHRVEAAIDTAIDRELIHEHELGRSG